MSFDKRHRGGFTLVELLIALVLAGIFAVFLFNFVNGQARFTLVQDARQEVEQNTRGALELMMSELRAVPGDGIEDAAESSIRVRVPRIWGLTCTPVSGNAVTVVFPPPHVSGAVFPSDFPSSGRWGIAIRDSMVVDRAIYATGNVNGSSGTNPAPCATALRTSFDPDSVPPVALALTLNGSMSGSFVNAAGQTAFLYQTVRYDVGSSSVAPGRWLRRTVESPGSTAQVVAGPLAEDEGDKLKFIYLCGEAPIDATSAANRPFVTGIRIITAMQSRPSTRSVLQVERDTVTVHLRNSGSVTCP